MSGAKRLMDQLEEHRAVATSIALKAGVLQRCELHSDFIFAAGADVTSAYQLGNAMFSDGKFDDTFEIRREMTDAIKFVVEDEYVADECRRCSEFENE
jgi:hypothetical protein